MKSIVFIHETVQNMVPKFRIFETRRGSFGSK